jgi:phage terminase small subunit
MAKRGRKSRAELALIGANRIRSSDSLIASVDEPAPAYLSAATKAWWCGVVRNHHLEPHQYRVLEAAAEAWDLMETARAALAKHGLSYVDNRGMVRQRPEAAIMRDNRAGFLRCMRELGLLKIAPPDIDHNAGSVGISWRQLQQRGDV